MPPRSPSNGSLVFRAAGLAAVAGGAAALASWAIGARWEVTFPSAMLAFPLFLTIGDLLEIPVERRTIFSLGLAPSLAFALLRTCAQGPAGGACTAWAWPHLGEVVAVFLFGSVLALVVRLARKRDLNLPVVAARLLVVLSASAVYRLVALATGDALSFGPSRMSAPGLAAMILVLLGLDVTLHSLRVVIDERLPLRQVARDHLRSMGLLLLSMVSVGALLALAFPPLGPWTLPIFLAPLLATHYSFRQVASIRKNYLQTVAALSKVPEMAGYTVRGHSARVARLSVDIAKELGIGDPELHEIEYAALLHDIGRISLPDPEEASRSTAQLELALVGAEIVEKTGHFPRVALMVRQQNEPYRRRGEDANRELNSGAKIIKVASAYDDLTVPGGPGRSGWDALERLHLGMAYEYDPGVIQALTRVLEKRTLI